jgi:hypothetical protein
MQPGLAIQSKETPRKLRLTQNLGGVLNTPELASLNNNDMSKTIWGFFTLEQLHRLRFVRLVLVRPIAGVGLVGRTYVAVQ